MSKMSVRARIAFVLATLIIVVYFSSPHSPQVHPLHLCRFGFWFELCVVVRTPVSGSDR